MTLPLVYCLPLCSSFTCFFLLLFLDRMIILCSKNTLNSKRVHTFFTYEQIVTFYATKIFSAVRVHMVFLLNRRDFLWSECRRVYAFMHSNRTRCDICCNKDYASEKPTSLCVCVVKRNEFDLVFIEFRSFSSVCWRNFKYMNFKYIIRSFRVDSFSFLQSTPCPINFLGWIFIKFKRFSLIKYIYILSTK